MEDYLKEVNKAPEDNVDDGSPSLPEHPNAQFTDFDFEAGIPGIVHDSRKPSDVPMGTRPWDVADFFANQGQTEPSFSQAETSYSQTETPTNTQLLGLGMTEALPPFEVMEEL